ncbi:MAG TPA: hypothetical protein VHM70_26590 [Polyangiaceae bacterium]|jgi:hypothetical protein|nr:hypothetical protein [Polyangiaceae bacterium]
MRIALGFFLFDMIVRSTLNLTAYDKWREHLEVARAPLRLPTSVQRTKIQAGNDPKFKSVGARYWATLKSCFSFLSPLPREKTLAHMDSALDYARYAGAWIGTRLGFVGNLLGIDEDWPMFSPNVRRIHITPRARLIYSDGTSEQVWLLSEPYDPTSFHRWFVKRPLQIDLRLAKDYDARLGVSRNLAERYAESEDGAKLESIEMFEVKYSLPKPGQNAYSVLAKQRQKAPEGEPFWSYDVLTGKGKTIESEKDKKAKEKKKAEAAKPTEPSPSEEAEVNAEVGGAP